MAAASAEDLKAAYTLARANKNELTPELLKAKLQWPNARVMAVLNGLVAKRLGALQKSAGSARPACLRVRDEEVAAGVRTLSADEYSVFKAIEEAGAVGAWTQDIARGTKLQNHAVQKAVKILCEQKRLIKPLKSIHQRNRKMYILANLEPAKEVVGGTFYDDGEFDEALVDRIRARIMHVLRNCAQAPLKDLSNFIKTSGLGRDLADDDLKAVLYTLQVEQQVISSVSASTGEVVYLWRRWGAENVFQDIPCGTCPVFEACLQTPTNALVCPATCKYFAYWLGYEEPPPLEEAAGPETPVPTTPNR